MGDGFTGVTVRPAMRPVLFRSFADGAACLAVFVGCAILAGWVLGISALKFAPRGTIVPKANAAAGFILCGASLWLTGRTGRGRRWPIVAETLAAIAALLGAVTLCEHLFGWDLAIDDLFAREAPGAVKTLHPGRMAPNTALSFLLLGVSLFLLQKRRGGHVASVLTVTAGTLSLLAVMGYAYAADEAHGLIAATTVATQTALAFMVLCAGVLVALADRGMMPVLDGATPGGAMARRLLPAVVALLPVIGWLRLEGERRGFYGEGFGIALMVTLAAAALGLMVFRNAGVINRADVSRRKAEEVVRRAVVYNRSLIEASLDPLVTISADGKVTDVNAATERVSGFTREQLVGTDFSDYFTDRERARAGYEQVFREGSVQDYALEVRHRDGHVTPVLYNAAVYRDEEGAVTGVFAAARDVTELKKAEEALRLAGVYNRSLIEASLDPLVTISADGKVTDVNAATERVTGYPREQLVGTDFSDYFTEPERARAGYEQVFREGSVQDYALEVRHRDGHVTPVLYNAAVYRDESGTAIGVFAAARDITERKKAEEALERRTEELARSNAELERFAYVASHDLQEPLRMVSSYVQLLARRYQGRLDSDADEFIGFAVDGAGRMQRLITDLLAFSRVGRMGKDLEPTPLDACLDQALKNLEVAIAESGAVVTRDPLPVVMGDSSQLVQVFQNLVGNALKFRGTEPPRVHVSARRDGRQWQLSVRDNGIGFDAQYAERIFIIFQRLHGRDYPGTGIGLPISRKIVERHGGRLWGESQPGKGSIFILTLPGLPDQAREGAAEAPPIKR